MFKTCAKWLIPGIHLDILSLVTKTAAVTLTERFFHDLNCGEYVMVDRNVTMQQVFNKYSRFQIYETF